MSCQPGSASPPQSQIDTQGAVNHLVGHPATWKLAGQSREAINREARGTPSHAGSGPAIKPLCANDFWADREWANLLSVVENQLNPVLLPHRAPMSPGRPNPDSISSTALGRQLASDLGRQLL